MYNRLTEAQEKNTFFDLLLNESLCIGKIYVPKTWIWEAGGPNLRLKAKMKYELLLRVAEGHGFAMDSVENLTCDEYVVLEDLEETSEEGLKTDCYIVARYSRLLQEKGYFEAAVSSILEQSKLAGCVDNIIPWLEQMLGRTRAFDILEEAISPVLIYKGADVCNNILNVFAEQFGRTLESMGVQVEYFDEQKEPLENLTQYIGRYFRAIFGVQTYLFQIKMADGVTYLHEKIKGPKLHLILDHPIWMKQQLMHDYPDFYVLSHDRNYVDFVKQYYNKKAIHFPIPGIVQRGKKFVKKYDLTFVGSMGDYRLQIQNIRELERQDQFLANRFLMIMRQERNLSAEKAFEKAFNLYRDKYVGEKPVDVFYRLRKVIYLVMDYYRYQILKTILGDGIRLDVFGDFWKSSAFSNYPNLVCHPGVTVEESLNVYAQSKISLNVMSWHKDGFTERVANIMLANTVLLSDRTSYLEENYVDGEELLLFSLDEMQKLPSIIKEYLHQQEEIKKIAEAGYQKTLKKYTWECETSNILKFLNTLE